MKILYLNPGAELGGAETSLLELLAGIRQQRPDWELRILAGAPGPLLEEARKMGVSVEVLELPSALARAGDSGLRQGGGLAQKLGALVQGAWASPQYARLLAQRAAQFQPDITHATGLKMQVLAAALPGRNLGRILWHIHDYVSWRPLSKRLLRALAARPAGALVNSNSVEEDLRRCCPRLGWTERLYNAVDAQALGNETAIDLDQAAGQEPPPAGTLRIGLVATYARWKGHMTYLDALQQIPRDIPWRAYIVGGPIYKTAGSQFSREELQTAIRERQLEDKVFLTGLLRGRGGIMKALDVVVHASTKPEPFGMVIIEAMALARPVIISNAGGAAELFKEGTTGLGHTPGEAKDLARQIERLLRDDALRNQLAQQGREHASAEFSRPRLARQLCAVYERVLGA